MLTFHLVLEDLLVRASRGTTTVPDDYLGQDTIVSIAETFDHVFERPLEDIEAHDVQPRILMEARVDVTGGT